jgi:transcriptional regulator with XRE-family HTH domain
VYRLSSEAGATGIILDMTTTPEKAADIKNSVSSAVGKSLKKRRLSSNISQVNLAAKQAELGPGLYLQGLNAVSANPSIISLANICYALGITLAEFFSDIHIALRPEPDQPRPELTQRSQKSVHRAAACVNAPGAWRAAQRLAQKEI